MLVKPVRWKHQQASGLGLDGNSKLREFGAAAFFDIVQIPKENQVAIGFFADRIKMQLKAFIAGGLVALHHQFADFIGERNGNRLFENFVVLPAMPMHVLENHGTETGIGKRIEIEFGPGALIMTRAYTATIRSLEALQAMKRGNHLLAQGRAECVVENLDIPAERVGCGGGVQGKLTLLLFHFVLNSS